MLIAYTSLQLEALPSRAVARAPSAYRGDIFGWPDTRREAASTRSEPDVVWTYGRTQFGFVVLPVPVYFIF